MLEQRLAMFEEKQSSDSYLTQLEAALINA